MRRSWWLNKDTESEYILIMRRVQKNKKPRYFGAVRMGKAYVSFHLVALYEFPELAEGLSNRIDETEARQGLSQLQGSGRAALQGVGRLDEERVRPVREGKLRLGPAANVRLESRL